MKPSRFSVQTLGCKANLADSQAIELALRRAGWEGAGPESAEILIVNSCTVTDEADRQSLQLAARLKKRNPHARVLFTGCSAEVSPERALAAAGVDAVVGNQDKHRLPELLSGFEPGVLGRVRGYNELLSRHPIDREWPEVSPRFFHPMEGESGRTRAFLKIQDGCDSFCTYCVIPYGRGPARSLTVQQVVAEVRKLLEQGTREVVLTGINLGEFGIERDSRPDPGGELGELVTRLLSETGLKRLRLGSLDPKEITSHILSRGSLPSGLAPHFHVSLQSTQDKTLRRMKRKYGANDVEDCLRALRGLDGDRAGGVYIGMDIIVGFPGETGSDFEGTVDALDRLPWNRLHVFPYSERSGTPATRLPGIVPQAERVRRARVLRELSLKRLIAHYERILAECRRTGALLEDVLMEGSARGPANAGGWRGGHSLNYLRVLVPETQAARNTVVRARPLSVVVDRPSGECAFLAEVAS
jgi:threonylcarbamoyladenosine tRNA methylthiotransferase MtaB